MEASEGKEPLDLAAEELVKLRRKLLHEDDLPSGLGPLAEQQFYVALSFLDVAVQQMRLAAMNQRQEVAVTQRSRRR